jgi:predicted transcriptional regulator of viral defense system
MRIEELNDYLREHKIHVFSIYDASKLISKPDSYTSKFLSRDKYVKRIVRGLYYTADATEYEVASKIVYPSYISLVSSLRFHNLTEQIPNTIFVVSEVQHRQINNLNGFKIKFKVVKKSMLYGYGKIDDVFVADPEKAVIDMIYLNDFTDYAEEVVQKKKLDISKLVDYAKRSNIKSVVKKIESMINAK